MRSETDATVTPRPAWSGPAAASGERLTISWAYPGVLMLEGCSSGVQLGAVGDQAAGRDGEAEVAHIAPCTIWGRTASGAHSSAAVTRKEAQGLPDQRRTAAQGRDCQLGDAADVGDLLQQETAPIVEQLPPTVVDLRSDLGELRLRVERGTLR